MTIDYERERHPAATRLGIRVTDARLSVKEERGEAANTPSQGVRLSCLSIDLGMSPMNGAVF